MRIFTLLLVFVAIAAYSAQFSQTRSQTPSKASVYPDDQSTDILFQSTDAGKTWQDLSKGLPKNMSVRQVLSQNGEVYIAAQGDSIYHSRDPKTGVWELERVSILLPALKGVFEEGKLITGLFPGRTGPYASVYDQGLYHRDPKTNLWEPIKQPQVGEHINGLVENPDGSLYVGCLSGVYKSTDAGKTWSHVFSDGWVSTLSSANGVLVGSGSKGIMRSTDGEHWTCVLPEVGIVYNINALETHFAAIWVDGPRLDNEEENRDNSQTLISEDAGKTWNRIDDGMSKVWGIFDLKQAGKYLFCSNEVGIYRSADGGKSWELVRTNFGLKDRVRLQLSTSGQTVFAVKVWAGGC